MDNSKGTGYNVVNDKKGGWMGGFSGAI